MKNRIKILLGAVIGSSLLLSSCNFLDVDNYFQATFKEDSIFHSMKNAEGYLWNTPTRFPDAGAIWETHGIRRNCLGRDCRQMADQRVLGSAIQCWYCQRKKPAAGYMV